MGLFKFMERDEKVKLEYSVNKYIFEKKDTDGRDLFQYRYYAPGDDTKLVTLILKHIYTDKLKHKYYQFVNPATLTWERVIAGSVANKEFQYNMTLDELNTICNDALAANNVRDFNTVANKLQEIKVRSQKLVEYETTLKLGAIYFLMDDEHPGRYNPLTTEKKIQIWREDEDARAFFLIAVWDMVKPYTELSSQDLLDYLTTINPFSPKKSMEKQNPLQNQEQENPNTGGYNTLNL